MSLICRLNPQFPATSKALLPRATQGVSKLATVERYAAIRNYFVMQVVCSQQSSSPRRLGIPHLCREKIPTRTLIGIETHFRALYSSQSPKGDATKMEHSSTDENQSQNGHPGPDPNLDNYPKFFQRLAQSLPHLQRPTKEDFLNVSTNFWQRVRVRFKWFTIRSFRRWNADEISAFFTWFLMTQTVWILVGTTTFFSVIFATANSLRMQEYIARALSDYLTAETGVTVAFESAIVPKWKDSRISFKKVYISRRPRGSVSRAEISSSSRNGVHKSAARLDVGNHPAYHHDREEDEIFSELPEISKELNYSVFDLDVGSIDVTLSLWKWLDGKGLIKDVTVKGVRGVLDRRAVEWDPSLDPTTFRHKAQPGDFELENVQVEDVLITVYQPGGFRPYTASIFRGGFKRLRKQWLFYDFLSAENIVGQFDNCLFSLHKPQSIGRTTEEDLKDGHWKRMSRFRIDGVNIDHIQAMTTLDGPLSWLTSGKLDTVVDIKFPRDPSNDVDINTFISEIATNISNVASSQVAMITSSVSERIPGQRELAKPPLREPTVDSEEETIPKQLTIDIDLRFRDLKAAVPIFTSELSYVNNALIRPIVAFINANRTLVPIHCRVLKDLDAFDGSWTMWESTLLNYSILTDLNVIRLAGLMDDISYKTYNALAYHVSHANMNRRLKTVSLWSLQMTANAALSALRKVVDSAQFREFYATL